MIAWIFSSKSISLLIMKRLTNEGWLDRAVITLAITIVNQSYIAGLEGVSCGFAGTSLRSRHAA